METVIVLLSVVCVSGALAQCHNQDPALFITAPKTMEALSGSCLMIPCNFRTKPEDQSISTRTTYGVWIKTDPRFREKPNNVIYNSSGTVNIYPMNITGDLSQRNCSTMFHDLTTTHTDKYYFRIDGSVKATAACDPVQINVKDALVPTITIPADLREQQAVTVTCSAFTPCPHFPPNLTWSLQPDPHNQREENTDGTFTTTIQETITLSEQHDGLNVSCSASYPVAGGAKAAQTVVTLSVSPAEPNHWRLIVGGLTCVLVLICLICTVWWLKFKHPSSHQKQSVTGEDLDRHSPARAAVEDTIHYGDISFSRLRAEPSSDAAQNSARQQDTVYAQVNVSAGGPESLYAQVKR